MLYLRKETDFTTLLIDKATTKTVTTQNYKAIC